MAMPRNLVLVRHGQSEANIMIEASKQGDHSYYFEDAMTVPDRSWRLSSFGVEQAQTAGAWVKDNIPTFDRHIVSPYVRTCETAAHLNIYNASWEENRVIRERSWGEITSIPRDVFREKYALNANFKKVDPLYWAPPGGESIANVAENRVRNVLGTLHRENSDENVLMVTHGEFIWATRLVLERWSDEDFLEHDKDPDYKIHNCTVIHYSKVNPETYEEMNKLRWVRRGYPVQENGVWTMKMHDWEEFDRPYSTNEQLLKKAESRSRYFEDIKTAE